ncbi:Na/Pi cotransporter family protein [Pelagibius sp.]|uniref:Na/Pi cotransporter family protein n=1 Tax=Pelagibius sp. TaxID=1931238 RepID=UPI002614CE50|nr:Na/Pi cotransporter family protein [Pelagibius sp.]
MAGHEILLHIAGGVALLLWSARMVRTGLLRAFGTELRKRVGRATKRWTSAALVGFGVTTALQSSTATAMLAVSFAGRGMIALAPALALMLGADLGSTMVVQFLSFDLYWLSPAFLVLGVLLFMTGTLPLRRHLGRVAVGLGLMILALDLTVSASEQLRSSATLESVFSALADETIVALLLGALLAWLFHSSVALVLLVVGMAAGGLISPAVAFPLVLGANVGSGIIPTVLTLRSRNEMRRIPLGNLLFRLIGAILFLPLLELVTPLIAGLDPDPARQVANFHSLFNLALVLAGLPLVKLMAKATERLLPATQGETPEGPRYLTKEAAQTPALALASATREALRMADIAEEMLGKVADAFEPQGQAAADELGVLDDQLDELNEAIKLYLADLTREPLDEAASRSCTELLSFTTNLEHIGDIISKSLRKSAQKKIRNKLSFSEEGWRDLLDIHARVADHLQLALSAFVTRDPATAQQLIDEKHELRILEQEANEQHLDRLRRGRVESIETSGMHIDLLRDLKRINSHITAIGYAVLTTEEPASQHRKKA